MTSSYFLYFNFTYELFQIHIRHSLLHLWQNYFYFSEAQSIVDAANVSFTIPSLFILLEIKHHVKLKFTTALCILCLLYIHIYANHIYISVFKILNIYINSVMLYVSFCNFSSTRFMFPVLFTLVYVFLVHSFLCIYGKSLINHPG